MSGNNNLNQAIKTVLDRPQLLRQTELKTAKINCPHCQLGFILVGVEKHGWGKQQEIKVPKIHEPHKCEVCGKWSRIKMQLRLTAVKPLEGEPQ